MDLEAATRIAESYLARQALINSRDMDVVLLREHTIERDFGWTFFYAPRDRSILVAGNAAFIIDRGDGSIHVTGTAYPVEQYMDSYERVGRAYPLAIPDYVVTIRGWKRGDPDVLRVSLFKQVRIFKSLVEAKRDTDEVVAGNDIVLTFSNEGDADRFCSGAWACGVQTHRSIRWH